MPVNKHRISSPLEAGASLLDAKQLPPALTSALEYVSSKLAQKGLHLSLIVVRKEVNIPSARSPSPALPKPLPSPTFSITTSPVRSLFNSATTFTKSLSRHSSRSSLKSEISSLSSTSSSSRCLSRTAWSSLPSSPKDRTAFPPSPTSPISPSSSLSSQSSTPFESNPYGITLMHAASLTSKAEKILRYYVAKAEKRYNIGTGYLPPTCLSSPSVCTATNDLLKRSLTQNEVLFTSAGLTLFSLDHIYTFKSQLHTYSSSLSTTDLTLAVDELHRLVLAQHGRRITKGYLMRAYDWLGVSLAALVDINEGYKSTYGGEQRTGGIEVTNEERMSPPPLKTSFAAKDIKRMRIVDSRASSPVPGSIRSIERLKEDKGPHRRGPATPNGFEDITPVTKGEWLFLMIGEGWKQAKLAAVETC